MSSVAADQASEESANTGPVTAATERFAAAVEQLDAAALAQPSLLPGWTRAHVVAHVARHADAMVNLLIWARTAKAAYQYDSAEQRTAGIGAGVGRPPADLVADLRASAERLATAVNDMPDEAWGQQVRRGIAGSGETIPARRVLWLRLVEVEVHHLDLRTEYSPADWAPWFTDRLLTETVRGFSARDDAPALTVRAGTTVERVGDGGTTTVSGSPAEVTAWLIGRDTGRALSVEPAGALPELPPWK